MEDKDVLASQHWYFSDHSRSCRKMASLVKELIHYSEAPAPISYSLGAPRLSWPGSFFFLAVSVSAEHFVVELNGHELMRTKKKSTVRRLLDLIDKHECPHNGLRALREADCAG